LRNRGAWWRAAALLLAGVLLLSGLALAGCQRKEAAEVPKELVIGFVPSVEAEKIPEKVAPLAEMLSKELGIPVKHFTSANFAGLVEAMGAKKVDVGWLNPLGYVLARDTHGVEVILKSVRRGSVSYKAQIVVRADSGINKLADLKGKKFGFVDPGSTSGYLFPAAHLKKNNMNPEKDFSEVVFLGGHDKVITAVYNGDVDAGATFADARARVEKTFPDVMQKVRILEYTGDIPNDTVSVRKGLDPAFVEQVKQALIKIASSEEGKRIFFDLYQWDGVAEAKDSDFDIIRETAKLMNLDIKKELGGG